MRLRSRLGVVGPLLLSLLAPAIAQGEPAAQDDDVVDPGELEPPCQEPLQEPLQDEEYSESRRIEVDAAEPWLTIALDTPVAENEPACVWTLDRDRPFYAADTAPCDDEFWGCRRVALKPLSIGEHRIAVRIGDASPTIFTVVRVPADCSLRPAPPLNAFEDDEEDEEEGRSGDTIVQVDDTSFVLTLPEPVALDGSSTSCWWFSPPGFEGKIDHQWPISACDGQDPSATTCVRVSPSVELAPGRYKGAVYVGTSSAQRTTLWVPPNMSWLWSLVALGFVLWAVLTVLLRGYVRVSRLERWKDHLDRRLEASEDDHKLLLARIHSALAFAAATLEGNRILLVLRDMSSIEQHLLEAEQLLTLSEKKTRIWSRANAQLYPPTVMAQILAELKLFDEIVLQRNYPIDVEEERDDEEAFPSLTRASQLVDDSAFLFEQDLRAALALALGEIDEDEPAPELAGEDDGVEAILESAIDCEQVALQRIDARIQAEDMDELPPVLRLEIDLRLDVLRKLKRVSANTSSHDQLDEHRLHAALSAWHEVDLQDSFTHPEHRRQHENVVRELVWGPDNRRFSTRFAELAIAQKQKLDATAKDADARARAIVSGEMPLTLELVGASKWPTFSPRALRITLGNDFRDLANHYPWRRLITVDWRDRKDKGLSILGGEGSSRVIVSGPQTVGFAREPGVHTLTPTLSLPEGAENSGHTSIPVAPLSINVIEGTRELQNKRIQRDKYAHLAVSLAGSIVMAAIFFHKWQGEPPPYVYWQALLLPVGVDLTALAVPQALAALKRLIPRLSAMTPHAPRDSDR